VRALPLAPVMVVPAASLPTVASSMNTKPPASSSSSSVVLVLVPSVSRMPPSLWRAIFSPLAAASMVPTITIRATRRSEMLLPARVTFRSSATSAAAAGVAIWASVRSANRALTLAR
jgi:hypothetical protein